MKNRKKTGSFLRKNPGIRIGIIALILLLVVGVSSAFTIEKDIQVRVEGKDYTISGKLLQNLEEVLAENDLPVSDEYQYSVSLTTLFKDVNHIDIVKKVAGNLIVDGKTMPYLSVAADIADLLKENDIELDEDDRVIPESNTLLTSQTGDVKVIRVSMVESANQKVVPMTASVKENPDLPVGSRNVIQAGQNGLSNIKERIQYEDGIEVGREVLSNDIITPAIEEVIEAGPATTITMPDSIGVTSTTGNVKIESSATGTGEATVNKESGFQSSMTVSATAYTATGNGTASGTMPTAGRTIAAGSGLPFGTKVYIPALGGVYIVEDRGGAVSNGVIDIYMNSQDECINWGRQNIEIFIMS
ncbi:MAG: G5 domain-containing protein [Acetobacterium sp.]